MNSKKNNIQRHVMTGISYMIPFVVAGGLCAHWLRLWEDTILEMR